MKSKLLGVLICLLPILNGCHSDDDSIPGPTLYTSWSLREVDGEFGGIDDDYELGNIIWHFDEASGFLTVENNNTDDTLFDVLESGNYPFIITLENGYYKLNVDNINLGYIDLSFNELYLSDVALDGLLLKLERINVQGL